jgi:hypothetical protein
MKRSAVWLVLFCLSAMVHADDKQLRDHVLAGLAKQEHKHFYFVQEKKLAMLDKPLVTEGELLLDDNPHDKNHTVTWDIQKPYALRYVLTRDTIREIDAQGERTLQVGQNPIAAALTQAMAATFSGQWKDTDALASITAAGTPTDWQLQIHPLAAELQPLIKTISVTGNEGIISSIVIAESNGDSTTIHLKTLPSP